VGILVNPQHPGCADESTPLGGKVCILRLNLIEHSLLVQVYGPNSSAMYQEFVKEIGDAVQRVKS